MNDLKLHCGETAHGMRNILMENSLLRVTVLPDAGAKIWQIHYKPLGADLLWNHPSLHPARCPLHACYDDTWSGGWDELFPNDEACNLLGHALPDHGELWTAEWEAELIRTDQEIGVHLRCSTPVSNFTVEKTLTLRKMSAQLEVRYKLANQGVQRFPFLLKLHPAFAVTSNHRIDFPPMTVVREPEFGGSLERSPLVFSWPDAPLGDTTLDLRRVPEAAAKALHFFYGTELAAGWCGITNVASKLSAALRFDAEVFSTCWLFASHGGWRDLHVAVLEPATGYPFRLQAMVQAGQARWLAPGQTLETTVLFAAQQGLTSIGGVAENGLILPGDES